MSLTHLFQLSGEQFRWVKAVLANDENSDDFELRAYFIENGLTVDQAEAAVAIRGQFLRGGLR